MNKVVLSVVAALAVSAAPAFAADMPVKASKVAVVAAPVSPWDIAFGAALTSDYVLRGVSQSNHKMTEQGYFELDYTATDWLKLYAGVWGSTLWTGFANAEFDITAGTRFTFGNFGLDVGYIYYYYPGGVNTVSTPQLANGSFSEVYAKPTYKFNDWLTVGGVFETGFNNFNNKVVASPGVWTGDARHYYYSANATIALPVPLPYGITVALNPEIGREYYSAGITTNMGFVSDTYWDVGLVFNYKAATLDLRYWGTSVKPGIAGTASANQCNSAIGSGGNSNMCGDRFVATLKFDTSFASLK
jgi:uncharacterized protein (TIGR02001 family)